MISYEEALAILHKAELLDTVTLPVQDACGYVLAEQVISNVRVPPFSNSAMDGFAVRSADLAHASGASPVILSITGSTAAGDKPSTGSGGAWEIMTGAPVPEAYDAVVKIEDVQVENQQGRFTTPTASGANIRAAGEDFSTGDDIAQPGAVLTPHHIMALAAIGRKDARVYRKPDLAVLSTGKELVEDADTPLLPGQIRNSNGPYLTTALQDMGYAPRYGGTIADQAEAFETTLKEIVSRADIVISTGAVSEGKYDFIPDSLRKLGAEILFHKVAVRPGKPILYARFPNGAHYFGLPGNPVSAVVGFRFFVCPLLRHLQSMPPEDAVSAKLTSPFSKRKGFRFFHKARVSVSKRGKLHLTILAGQESFRIGPLLQANGWAVLLEDQERIETGETAIVYPLMPEIWRLEPAP